MTSSPNWITDSPFRPCGRDYRTPRRPASRDALREAGRHTWGKFKRRFWGESLRRSQRQEVVHQPEHDGACTCPACGGAMAKLGEDVTEVLDYIPGRFQVIRHVRPKYACRHCDAITQAAAPALPTPRGRAAPGM